MLHQTRYFQEICWSYQFTFSLAAAQLPLTPPSSHSPSVHDNHPLFVSITESVEPSRPRSLTKAANDPFALALASRKVIHSFTPWDGDMLF
jgi:hypothetical protein